MEEILNAIWGNILVRGNIESNLRKYLRRRKYWKSFEKIFSVEELLKAIWGNILVRGNIESHLKKYFRWRKYWKPFEKYFRWRKYWKPLEKIFQAEEILKTIWGNMRQVEEVKYRSLSETRSRKLEEGIIFFLK